MNRFEMMDVVNDSCNFKFGIACARRVEHLHPVCKLALDVAVRVEEGKANQADIDVALKAIFDAKVGNREDGEVEALSSAWYALKGWADMAASEARHAKESSMCDPKSFKYRQEVWDKELKWQYELLKQLEEGGEEV